MPRRPVSTLDRVLAEAVALGASAPRLRSVLGGEPWLELPIPERIRRSEALWRAALELAGPTLPARYAAAVEPDDFAILGLAIRTAPTVGDALDRVLRFQTLFAPAPLWAREGEGSLRFVYPDASDPLVTRAVSEAALAELPSVLGKAAGAPLRLRRATLRHRPPDEALDALQAVLGVRPEHGPDARLDLERDELDRALVRADEGVGRFLVEQLEDMVEAERRAREPTVREQVAERIREQLPSGLPSMQRVARRMGMSERTLRRRLEEEGASWAGLVQETRIALACRLLRETDHSPGEVAFLLGFSEPSAFFRAFRRWTGRTPTAWREGRTD